MNARERKLLNYKKRILSALSQEDADFDLHLLNNSQMNGIRRSLQARRDFKGPSARKIAREKMVSVLSFPHPKGFPHPDSSKKHLGEVYLNMDFDRKNIGRLESLILHGVLHLLGYRHDGVRDTMKMEALEKKISTMLNI